MGQLIRAALLGVVEVGVLRRRRRMFWPIVIAAGTSSAGRSRPATMHGLDRRCVGNPMNSNGG